MIINLYSIKDKLNEFATPIPFYKDEEAKRYFKDQCTGGNPWITRNKDDFELYHMGQLNTETGTIVQNEVKLLEKGENYVIQERNI